MALRLLFPLILPLFLSGALWAQEVKPAASDDAAEMLLHMPEALIGGLKLLTDGALDAAPQVIDARLSVLNSEASEDQTRSLTRPSLNANLNAAYYKNNVSNMGSFQTYFGIVAEQPLWHWNALDNQKRIAKIQRQLADNDYDEARRSLVLDIRQRYLALVLQKRGLAGAVEAYGRQKAHLKVSREQAARGQLSADVLTNEQLEVSAADVACDRQQALFARALRDFAVINGLPVFSPETLPSEIPPVPKNALAMFTAEMPSPSTSSGGAAVPVALAAATSALATARLNEDVIRVHTRPMLDLVAGINQGETSGADQAAVLSYYGGVSVNWAIFDGFATRAATHKAQVVVRQNEKALGEARTALASQLTDGAADVAFAARDLQIAEEHFKLTESRQRVDDDLHQSGRLADADWQDHRAATQIEQTNLFSQRGQLILLLAQQELLRQRATKPSAEIPFP